MSRTERVSSQSMTHAIGFLNFLNLDELRNVDSHLKDTKKTKSKMPLGKCLKILFIIARSEHHNWPWVTAGKIVVTQSQFIVSLVTGKELIHYMCRMTNAASQFWQISGSRDGVVVIALASSLCGPGLGHDWVKLVVGSLLCFERFFSGFFHFPLSSKINISKFQFDRMQDLPENHFRVSGASWVKF